MLEPADNSLDDVELTADFENEDGSVFISTENTDRGW
jgi:hypothetical protein